MKRITIFIPIFLICVIAICAVTPAVAMSEDISNNVFRLHILSNSDSDYDQALKLKVRDKVLQASGELFSDCTSVDEAIAISEENKDYLRDVAQKTLAFYDSSYVASVYVTKEYFNTRIYDGFTLPAGVYNSLKIVIGEGKGKNWWCVMFPSVCISGCTDDFSQSLTPQERKMIESDGYVVRFKAVEVYEKIKSMM